MKRRLANLVTELLILSKGRCEGKIFADRFIECEPECLEKCVVDEEDRPAQIGQDHHVARRRHRLRKQAELTVGQRTFGDIEEGTAQPFDCSFRILEGFKGKFVDPFAVWRSNDNVVAGSNA